MLWVAPSAAAIGEEELGDTAIVQVALYRSVGDVTQTLEDERDLVFFDQFTNLLDGLGRAVPIIPADQVYLATIDATIIVDHLEVGEFGSAHGAINGDRPAIRHCLADLDLCAGDAWRICCGCRRHVRPRVSLGSGGQSGDEREQ